MDKSRPEIAINTEWSRRMFRERTRRGLTQRQLAEIVKTSQNMISLIESGGVGSSEFVLPICEALGIRPPSFESEEVRRWADLGERLRNHSPKQYANAIRLIESMLPDDEIPDPDHVGNSSDPR